MQEAVRIRFPQGAQQPLGEAVGGVLDVFAFLAASCGGVAVFVEQGA
nr:hypothetical protein [Streptantibioticus cattleyicolor]